MQYFPFFVRMTDALVVIVGGGEAAAQKLRLIRRTPADIVIMSPDLCPELADLVQQGNVRHVNAVLDPAVLQGARLVFVASGCAATDAAAAVLAQDLGALVNVVDRPALCDVVTPAIVDRDPVVVAIGTEGTAPVLGRRIKSQIERFLEPQLGDLAQLAGSLRGRVAHALPSSARRRFWDWVFGPLRQEFTQAGRDRIASRIERVLTSHIVPTRPPMISIVEVPDFPDLLSLRAVQRMQGADTLCIDPGVPQQVLDLARRDAARIAVPGSAPWQTDTTAHLIAGQKGETVWLTLGDGNEVSRTLRAMGRTIQVISAGHARAENGRPDTDMGRAKGNRPLEIAAHPH